MPKSSAIERLRLKAVTLTAMTTSPLAGGGAAAPVGSRVLGPSARQWLKRGATNPAWIQLALRSYYFNVRDFGATGDGITDDRAAINAAVAAAKAVGGGVVFFPPGDYACYRSGVIQSINLTGADSTNIVFLGCGRSSRVMQVGDAGGGGGDWYLFNVSNGATKIAFKNLCLDGSQIFNVGVGQQHHGVRAGGTAVLDCGDITFIDCYWNQFDGDGVNLVGNSGVGAASVRDTLCKRGVFTMDVGNPIGSRAGFTVQRNVFGVRLLSSYFTGGSDQLIDMETSGTGQTQDVLLTRNHVESTAPLVSTAVGLSGAPANDFNRVVVANMVINNGALLMIDLRRGVAKTIMQAVSTYASVGSALRADGLVDIAILRSQFHRADTDNGVGAIINIVPGVVPARSVIIAGVLGENANTPGAGQDGVNFESVDGAAVIGCQLRVGVGAANNGVAVRFRGITSAALNSQCRTSILYGVSAALRALIAFSASGANATDGLAHGNMGGTTLFGVSLSQAGGGVISGAMVAGNNVMQTNGQMLDIPSPTPQAMVISGNGGALARGVWEFAIAPGGAIAAQVGAIGCNRNGGGSTTFYVKEADGGLATGWTAK